MAHWFVGPIMDKLINACSDYLQDHYFRWQTGKEEELERLRVNHPRSKLSSLLPTRLRDAIDEADDVLDDFEYMKLEEEEQKLNMEEKKLCFSFTRLFSEPARKLQRVCERALKIDPNLERLEAVVKKLDKVSAEESSIEGETLEDIGGRYSDVLVRKS